MTIRDKYNSYAPYYDFISRFVEPLFGKDKRRILRSLKGTVLEVGVGTGASFQYYDFHKIKFHGIDISENMLCEAKNKFNKIPKNIHLEVGNIHNLNFPSEYFDYVVSCDVFCSVKNPIKGLKEIKRVLNRNGFYIGFEHVRSKNKFLGKLLDFVNRITSSKSATNMNRDIGNYILKAGLNIILDKNIHLDIIKILIAKK